MIIQRHYQLLITASGGGVLVFQLKRFAGWLLGVLGVVLAILSSWDLVDHLIRDQNYLSIAANVFVLGIVSCLLIFLFFRSYQTIRKEKYANITPFMHSALHAVRDLDTYLHENEPAHGSPPEVYSAYLGDAKRKVVQVLDRLADVFRILTSTHCRTGVKLMYEHDEELYFYTYARDHISIEKCRLDDRKRVHENHDPLNKNRRFTDLFSEKQSNWHYFSNDLQKDEGFTSTSVSIYNPEVLTSVNGSRGNGIRRRWLLPYRSTISCVIRQGACDIMESRDSDVIGFLTVDSESRGVFLERWDAELMFAIADALFRPLSQINKVQNEAITRGVRTR